LAKFSPSEYLIAEVLKDGCRHGFTNFDFGVGANRFKKVWSNGAVGLFNVTHAASAKGQLYAGMMRLAAPPPVISKAIPSFSPPCRMRAR
jgi:CelD/BcsL family acetyltransferase involved in cellulose biosynthesis